MLKVDQYDYIRTAHRVYGKAIKELARETGHSKNTIKKILKQEYIGYKQRSKQPYPVLGPYIQEIDRWLGDDKDKPYKQRHTATRIYHRLKSELEYSGGETTVRRYVREAKLRLGLTNQQAFIPSDPTTAQEAEVDWGNCQAVIAGEPVKLKLFCIRSKCSGKHFVRCYPCERQQALFDAHIQAFSFFGGVFPVLIYDNLTTVVQKVFKGKKRHLQESYNRFKAYYNFDPRFCNPGQGHEKGGIEGLVGYARRNYMVPIPHADSLDELNTRLLDDCMAYGEHRIAGQTQSVNELFESEKQVLLPLPTTSFSNVETFMVRVNKYATVIIDKNRYSVPTRYAYMRVQAMVEIDQVIIYWSGRKISTHHRLYGNNKWSLKPEHYLELIRQRPQSFDTARPILQWRDQWPDCLEKLLEHFRRKNGVTKGTREFVTVLMLYEKYAVDKTEAAVKEALKSNVGCSNALKQILHSQNISMESQFDPLSNWETLPPADISAYEQLGGIL
ncbi:IS21 family transposase [uncultured Desulfobacter sp.]|uniref:IS21 family transposase n=1 Tax=uncultured Desulfobacter sp. TaxID=240139 RepID=UPI0029F57CB9|nr:IS21 family transposase [uncultured Desulfobacter sp.]